MMSLLSQVYFVISKGRLHSIPESVVRADAGGISARDKTTSWRLGGCRCCCEKAVKWPVLVTMLAEAGPIVGGFAVVTDERSDVGGNCAVAASAGDLVMVSRVGTKGEEGCWHSYNRFGGEGNATDQGEQLVRFISWRHELGSYSPGQGRREVVTAVAGAGSLSDNWWPWLAVGWATCCERSKPLQ